MYNKGISRSGDVLDLAVTHGFIEKSGPWFSFNEQKFSGRESMRNYLLENPKEMEKLAVKVQEKIKAAE
jgi:recombination protein RecA